MLIDILSQSNNVTFNSYIANKIGLNAAIYLGELINQYSNSENNKKMNGDYFSIDRVSIFARTTLDEATQKNLDIIFVKLNIMLKRMSILDPNLEEISLNMQNLVNIFASDNEKIIKDLNKMSKLKTAPRMSQRDQYKLNLKNSLVCSNDELLQAYRDWVEGVYANPKGFLSTTAIKIFQETVDKFAKGNLDLALKIVEIATINGYRDAEWAINLFHKNYEKQFNLEYGIKSNKPTDRKVQLSNEVF